MVSAGDWPGGQIDQSPMNTWKVNNMKKQVGLWIDHRKAVIVMITEAGEEIKKISSNMEKHVRFTGGRASEDGSTEDVKDRQFGNHLNNFYDAVISVIRDAGSILIFGPGEAKGEMAKRLEHKRDERTHPCHRNHEQGDRSSDLLESSGAFPT